MMGTSLITRAFSPAPINTNIKPKASLHLLLLTRMKKPVKDDEGKEENS